MHATDMPKFVCVICTILKYVPKVPNSVHMRLHVYYLTLTMPGGGGVTGYGAPKGVTTV